MALDPAYLPNYARLADVYLELGRPQEALAVLERGVAIGGETRRQNEGFAVVFAALGRRKEAGEILSHFRQMAAQGSDQVAYRIALIEMALGHPDAAIDWLERAYRERSASLWLVNPELKFEPLRADPRFQSLLKRMNYPPS
jgi:tetratricopeptide (TPR) repeat protein